MKDLTVFLQKTLVHQGAVNRARVVESDRTGVRCLLCREKNSVTRGSPLAFLGFILI